jgi:hypothetical protein
MAKKTIYLIWNTTMTECVGTDDQYDAYWIAHGAFPPGYEGFGVPSIGETFREYYAEDGDGPCWTDDNGDEHLILPMTTIEVEDMDIQL